MSGINASSLFLLTCLCVLFPVYSGYLYLTPGKEFSVRVGIQNPVYVDCSFQSEITTYDDCHVQCFGSMADGSCRSFTWEADEKTCFFCSREIDDDGILANETTRWVGPRIRRYIDRCPIDVPEPTTQSTTVGP
ncbi:uncharacterized protein LOC134842795 [Symsagittifera roscoffensis]|uniref:uncharacterized protein LOC134842795 n=1 Tax=Symsagittifera roscoffensis TaxID=84072 RepID=UPI00307C54AD